MELPLEFRLPYFRELIQCAHNLYSWSLNSRFEIIYSNCPNTPFFRIILSLDWSKEETTELDWSKPIIFTNSLGLIWAVEAVREQGSEKLEYHLIGPAFYGNITHQSLYSAMQEQRLSASLQNQFIASMADIPIISITRMMEYAIMLHYTLTGEHITSTDIRIQSHSSGHKSSIRLQSRHNAWAAEQALLKLVEDGNLNYKQVRSKFNLSSDGGQLVVGNPLRQVKNQIIIYITLCTRAAIRGGLLPETAYTLSDQYIQRVEGTDSISELAEINEDMQENFIHRVHQLKIQSGISKSIRACQDYIQLHVMEKITLEDLAEQVNYSANHLSRKFRQETGKTVMDYVTECKIERAKQLLVSGNDSIQSISEQLGFGAQSYFGAQFKKITGMSAGEYRSRYGRTEETQAGADTDDIM